MTSMATVLYVDDEDALRRAVVAWLTRHGHTVHTAATLADARDLLECQTVDGAFVDLRLGEESGLELQRWIDQHHPELSRKVVLVTGEAGASYPAGEVARPILAKPFDLRKLDELIAAWVGEPQG